VKRSAVTTRCENEVSIESKSFTEVTKTKNKSSSSVASEDIESIIELCDENLSSDDSVSDNFPTHSHTSTNSIQQKFPSLLRRFSKPKINQLACLKCGMKFNSQSQLMVHFLSSHPDKSDTPFECQLCDCKVKSKFNLNRHYMSKRHREDPRFLCNKIT